MKHASLLGGLIALAFWLAPASAEDPRSVNYGVGPPSPYSGRDMNFDFKYGEPKRDAETMRTRREQPQTTINPEDFVSLEKVPADRLANAPVENGSGIAVGHVTSVSAAKNGPVTELEVALDKAGKIRIPAEDLRFNPTDRVLLLANESNSTAASLAASESDGNQ